MPELDDNVTENTPGHPKVPKPITLAPELEALVRKIAKEEIGKALGHTIV